MATADDLTAAKNNALQTTTLNTNNLQSIGNNVANIGTKLASNYTMPNLSANLTSNPNMKTVYASGTDLANAHNVYGNTVNYGDINHPNLKAGDIVAGGSGVTPNITDDMIKNSGASRLYGDNANGTLGAMQTNSKTTLPQYYQNTNNNILAQTSYQNLNPNLDVSGYKNQISDALNNAGNYHYVQSNNVGMDNTPYTNAINSATSNANSQATNYQNAVQKALDAYNGVSTTNGTPSAQDIYNNSKSADEYYSNMAKYYPDQLKQIRALQQQAANEAANGQDMSELKQHYQSVLDSGKGQQSTSTTANDNTPISNADYIKNMTDRINGLYDTQRNNVGLKYQTGIDQAKQQYAGLKNQASVGQQQNLNKLKESIAGQGLFNSGDNITQQGNINNQYQNDLTGYNQQEQNYYNTTNNQIAQDKANYDAQQAQAMMDMYNNADSRSFKLADLDNQKKQQAFQNAMMGINAQYGMGQDQFGNTLKGTSTTYGMGRDNVSDQMYNNDSQMKADQINYGRDQDYFNNQLKAIGQQYGMDEDQVNNLLKYAQFNSGENQRQFSNGMAVNSANSGLTQQQTDNSYRQQQANAANEQWQKNYDTTNSHWDKQFTYQQQQDEIQNQLAQARLNASLSRGGSGGRSGGSSKGSSKGSSSSGKYYSDDYANDAKALANEGYNSSFIKASMPTWDYESLYNGEDVPIYGGGR